MRIRNTRRTASVFAAARAVGLPPSIGGVAFAAGVDPDTLGDILAGVRRPTVRTLARLASALRTTRDGVRVILAAGDGAR